MKNSVEFLIIKVFKKLKIYNFKNKRILNIIKLNLKKNQYNLSLLSLSTKGKLPTRQ